MKSKYREQFEKETHVIPCNKGAEYGASLIYIHWLENKLEEYEKLLKNTVYKDWE